MGRTPNQTQWNLQLLQRTDERIITKTYIFTACFFNTLPGEHYILTFLVTIGWMRFIIEVLMSLPDCNLSRHFHKMFLLGIYTRLSEPTTFYVAEYDVGQMMGKANSREVTDGCHQYPLILFLRRNWRNLLPSNWLLSSFSSDECMNCPIDICNLEVNFWSVWNHLTVLCDFISSPQNTWLSCCSQISPNNISLFINFSFLLKFVCIRNFQVFQSKFMS